MAGSGRDTVLTKVNAEFSRQSSSKLPAPTSGDFLLYQTEDGRTRIDARFQGETVWLSLNQLANLFQRDKSVISRHIKNLFEEGELRPESVVANFATTAADAKTYQVRILQSRRDYLSGLPGQIASGHAVPHLPLRKS